VQSRGAARRPGGLATLLGLVLGLATLAALLVALLPGHGPGPRARAAPSSAVPASGPSARIVVQTAGEVVDDQSEQPGAAADPPPVVRDPRPQLRPAEAETAGPGRTAGATTGRSPPRTAGT